MSEEATVSAAPSTNAAPADFAKWIGIDPALLDDDAAAAPVEAEGEEAADEASDEAADDAPVDAAQPAVDAEDEAAEESDGEPDGEAEEPKADAEPEEEAPVKLPFEAKAKDEAVDPSLLQVMELTFKADGQDVTMSLSDVVRRAMSEPAVQRQAYQLKERVQQYESQNKELESTIAEVREIALRMARDPDFYAQVQEDVEGYDQPEARAERAEQALASERRKEQEARERAERESRLQTFAANHIAPTLERIVSGNPLVTQEEILGKFMADTSKITVNGVIPPEYHESVAEYLRTELAAFAAKRQSTYAEREAKAKAEALKTQRERQKLKNQSAKGAKPVGSAGALRGGGPASGKPKTIREGESAALSVLLEGMA